MLNINLQSEYIFSILGLSITNTFLTSVLVTLVLGTLSFLFYSSQYKSMGIFVNIVKIVIFEFLKLIDMVTRDRTLTKKILPLIATFFLFIISANLLGLLPGFLGSFFIENGNTRLSILRSPNSDLTTTLALAMISIFAVQYFSIQTLGFGDYLKRFLDFSSPIKFILGLFEFLSELIKILSFSVRLFGNIFAGEVLLLVVAFLIPYILPLPFMILEIFVGVIQAFIFAILTLTFIKLSTVRQVKVTV